MKNIALSTLIIFLSSTLFVKAFAYEHTVMLRVVTVTPDWMPYASTDGWTQAVPVKESHKLKIFEAAIWEETASIHLYEFPNDYDGMYGQYSDSTLGLYKEKTDQEKIDYREQHVLKVFSNMPTERIEKSNFIKLAFMSFVEIIAARYPNSKHSLMYSGHGGAGGGLFAAELSPKHSQDFLNHWTNTIKSKLAFVDMGGPCNKGGYSDLNSFCPFSEYYIASDLPNGGYEMDDWTYEKYEETDPESRYHDLIANNNTLLQVLEKRIELKSKGYEYSRLNMTQNKTEQANYLYSCQSFKTLYDLVEPIKPYLSPYSDLYSSLEGYGNTYTNAFNSVIVKKADNRHFFPWEEVANGILTPNSIGFSIDLESLSYPNLSLGETKPTNRAEVDVSPLERNINHTTYFLLQINKALKIDVSVDYTTSDNAAIAGQDYKATSGTAVIKAGETYTTIPVEIIGDTVIEPDEKFLLSISNPQGASFPEGVTTITSSKTIINDD